MVTNLRERKIRQLIAERRGVNVRSRETEGSKDWRSSKFEAGEEKDKNLHGGVGRGPQNKGKSRCLVDGAIRRKVNRAGEVTLRNTQDLISEKERNGTPH